jgi:hypothetical protein
MARLATDATGAAPLTGNENDPKMQMTILPRVVKSNPVFSAAIILASLMESYYRYCTYRISRKCLDSLKSNHYREGPVNDGYTLEKKS